MSYLVSSLCELLSVASCLPTTTGKFEEFISDVLVILWGWAQHSNGEIACAALKYVVMTLVPSIHFVLYCKC